MTFDESLSAEEKQIIEEELQLLAKVQSSLLVQSIPEKRSSAYQDIIELRNSLSEIRAEDIPSVLTDMERLVSLERQQQQNDGLSLIKSDRPYFGHMRIEEGNRVRDILIGDQQSTSTDLPCPIIDWKKAPLSKLFYRYEEGDEFEEEVGNREMEGLLSVRRSLSIEDGQLIKVVSSTINVSLQDGVWKSFSYDPPKLSAVNDPGISRSASFQDQKKYRVDKHLQEVTALIDKEQFDIISQPESGVVVIQGGAGSGKTTVALHRLAYLVAQKPDYFTPNRTLPIVFNKALARYMSKVFPALGVPNTKAWVYSEWVSHFRKRYFPKLPQNYAEHTPVPVIELKKHPAMYVWLQEEIQRHATEFKNHLLQDTQNMDGQASILQAWDLLEDWPLAQRILRFQEWVRAEESLPGVTLPSNSFSFEKRVDRILHDYYPHLRKYPESLAFHVWQECFIYEDKLQEAIHRLAPESFTEDQIKDVWKWGMRQYEVFRELELWDKSNADNSGLMKEAKFDEEDDTLLLLLYQMTVGPFRGKKNKIIQYNHLLIDEAQDFSPLEMRLLIQTTPKNRRSVTLAGDMDQKIVIGNYHEDWPSALKRLGMENANVASLKVGYRSTYEITQVAKGVIGPISVNTEWNAIRHGPPVEMFKFQNHGQLIDHLSKALTQVAYSQPNAYLAVLTRYPSQANMIYEGLEQAEVPAIRRVKEQDFSFQPGVEITDIRQVKGLEFDNVILVDADNQSFPDNEISRHMLYVGVTRPAHQLWLTTCHKPSPLLPLEHIVMH